MSTKAALDGIRLELALIAAEVSALSSRVQNLSSRLADWAEESGFADQIEWEVVEEGGKHAFRPA